MFSGNFKPLTSGFLEINPDTNTVIFHPQDNMSEINFELNLNTHHAKPVIHIEGKQTQLNDIPYYQKRNIMSFLNGDIVKSMMMVNKEFNKAFKDDYSKHAKLSLLQWQYQHGVTNFKKSETRKIKSLKQKAIDQRNKLLGDEQKAKKWGGIKVGHPMSTNDWMCCFGGCFAFCGAIDSCVTGCMQWAPGCLAPSPSCSTANLGGTFAYSCCCCFPLSNACLAGYALLACGVCFAAPLAVNSCYSCCQSYSIDDISSKLELELNNLPVKCETVKQRLLIKMNFFAKELRKDQKNEDSDENDILSSNQKLNGN